MSCVGFFTPRQLARVRAAAADTTPVSSFRSPAATEGKIDRVRSMAGSADPRIRESAALSSLADRAVLSTLAVDRERSVRCCVARNEHAPADVLELLAADTDAGVRGWVAANASTPPSVLERLADDADPTVQAVVAWAARWD